MDIISIIVLAIGLAMDAFAVSVTNGMCNSKSKSDVALKIGFAFGIAQGLMPVIGFFAGRLFSNLLTQIDHWVALILLSAIGIKMIVEAIKSMRSPEDECKLLSNKLILVQAVATSIDALAVGISFAAIKVEIFSASSIIAIITFLFCFCGFFIGKKFGTFLKQKAEIFGGVILILIGLKIFIEHVM